jgi:myo-inositol-1(or 4)-monophosphatase
VVLVEEAGGRVTAYDCSPLQIRTGRVLATNGHLHDRLSKELLRVRPLASWDNPAVSGNH